MKLYGRCVVTNKPCDSPVERGDEEICDVYRNRHVLARFPKGFEKTMRSYMSYMKSRDDVIWLCEEHSKMMYPNAGKFKKADVESCDAVKKCFFDLEYIWINVVAVLEDGVIGTIANIPVFPTTPKFGTTVFVKYEEIVDIASKKIRKF